MASETGGRTAHPPAGHFVPDLTLDTEAGRMRLADLMHHTRPLLDLTGRTDLATVAAGWKDRVDIVTAGCEGVPANALFIRPHGYVAWGAAHTSRPKNRYARRSQALRTWFGAETAPLTAALPRESRPNRVPLMTSEHIERLSIESDGAVHVALEIGTVARLATT